MKFDTSLFTVRRRARIINSSGDSICHISYNGMYKNYLLSISLKSRSYPKYFPPHSTIKFSMFTIDLLFVHDIYKFFVANNVTFDNRTISKFCCNLIESYFCDRGGGLQRNLRTPNDMSRTQVRSVRFLPLPVSKFSKNGSSSEFGTLPQASSKMFGKVVDSFDHLSFRCILCPAASSETSSIYCTTFEQSGCASRGTLGHSFWQPITSTLTWRDYFLSRLFSPVSSTLQMAMEMVSSEKPIRVLS